MSDLLLHELPYLAESADRFEALADRPWSMFLDSGRGYGALGRYDILAADPVATLVTRDRLTEIRAGGEVRLSREDPFALVRELLGAPRPDASGVPFTGGALGYFAYDLAWRVERLPVRSTPADGVPEMAVGIYDWALVTDHAERRSFLVSQGRYPATRAQWGELVARFSAPPAARVRRPFRVVGELTTNLPRAEYGAAFRRVKHYLREGDCYQVNLARRFTAPVEGDPWLAYRTLRTINTAPFAAYLNLPGVQVLSASPERFLRLEAGAVETRPIKGTRPRSVEPTMDWALAEELRASPKDRAENVMIVDLLRNDLGRSCAIGSVRVPELFRVEHYATVHHLVSAVTGRLAAGEDAVNLLRGCFPGGSITGAPKLRSMEVIEELEPHRRSVYCGAIGWLGHNGDMDTNIAIRTLVHTEGEMRCWAGGGIVMDSEEGAEYQETLDKAAAMLRLLERREAIHVGG